MKKLLTLTLVLIMVLTCTVTALADGYTYVAPEKSLKLSRATPEEKGISSEYIYNLLNELEIADIEMHSIMIAVGGDVIFEGFWTPYGPDIPHMVHSLTKLFTNAAAGVAVTDGYMSLDTRIAEVFPDMIPADADPNWQKITLAHLITMTAGVDRQISGSKWRPLKTSWLEDLFKEPVPYEPGTYYQYSSGNAYGVSAMAQQTSGMTALDLLLKSGFGELGMKHFTWDISPEGICSGGNGVTVTTEDMLKVGILFPNMGNWNGKQILAEDWCRKAIGLDKVVENQGTYAFHWTDMEDGCYTAGGAYGQTVILVPELDMVIAATAGTSLNSYPVFKEQLIDRTRADGENRVYDGAYASILSKKAKALNLLQNVIYTASPVAEKINSKLFTATENEDNVESIRLDFGEDYIDFTMVDDRGEHTIRNGIGKWVKGETTMTGNYLHHQYQNPIEPYTAYAEWENDTTLVMTWRYQQMSFVDTVRMSFAEDGSAASFIRSVNVNSSALVRPEIILE